MPTPQPYAAIASKPARILKDKLMKGERVYGTLFQNAISAGLVDFLPPGVLDFAVISVEHNALDLADFMPMRYALASKGIACLARIHSQEPYDVAKAADAFDGVVIPYFEDVELGKRLAAAAVFRPLKGVALERVIKEGKWPSEKTRHYVMEEKCADTLFIPMIESVRAIENLDAICAIPGISALFIGPNDMTTNMGIPNEYDHPDFIAVVQKVIDRANQSHIPAGSWFGKTDQMLRTIRQGARLVIYSNECNMMRDAMEAAFGLFRKG